MKSTKDLVEMSKAGQVDLMERFEKQKETMQRLDRLGAFITKLDAGTGFSLAVKDNICVKGIKCTAGSRILEKYIASYSATAIEKCRGFSIVGKTSLDPFGAGSGGERCDFGSTANPYDESRVPGGSSSGSAVALATGMCDFALGTDTFGSARTPASFCGVVGFRPSYGLVSRHGLISLCMSLDIIAPMARDVWGVAYLLSHITGKDKKDALSIDGEGSYHGGLEKFQMSGKRFGIITRLEGLCNNGVLRVFNEGVKAVESIGGKIIDIDIEDIELCVPAYYLSCFAEFSSDMQRYGSWIYGFNDLLKARQMMSEEVKRRVVLGTLIMMREHRDKWYRKAAECRKVLRERIEKAMSDVDFIITPTMPVLAWRPGTLGVVESYRTDIFTGIAPMAGLPAISIPCGKSKGLPVGLQIIGKRLMDKQVLGAAYRLEECL